MRLQFELNASLSFSKMLEKKVHISMFSFFSLPLSEDVQVIMASKRQTAQNFTVSVRT